MNAPQTFATMPTDTALDPDNLGCDLCSAYPVVVNLDGDRMCRTCADAWARGQELEQEACAAEDEADDLRRSLRGAGVYRGAMIEARLSDIELVAHSRSHRQFNRQERRAGGAGVSGHTPGPWAPNLPTRSDGALLASHVVDAQGITVAQLAMHSDETVAANARLIAAAPELLEALEALLNQDCPNRQYVSGHPAAEQARAAIARATGAA